MGPSENELDTPALESHRGRSESAGLCELGEASHRGKKRPFGDRFRGLALDEQVIKCIMCISKTSGVQISLPIMCHFSMHIILS